MGSFYERINTKVEVNDEREDALSRATVDKWIIRLQLVLIGIMPLIVLANVEDVISPLISNVSAISSGTKGELFTHFKSIFVLVIAVLSAVLLLVKVFLMNGTIKKTWINYILGLFAFAIILSTVFSPNITIALNGAYNRSDGAISWLSYITLMFVAMNIEYPKKIVTYIMYTMMPFVYINLFIITMNFYGKDLLQYGFMKSLVSMTLPEGSSISDGSQLLGTLNQWNYMSGMFAMMAVMYLVWAITSKKWSEAVIGAVTASAAISVMYMSISTSGFLTVSLLLILIIVAIFHVGNKKMAVVSLALFLVISAPVFHVLASKNENVWTESFGFFTDSNPYTAEVVGLLKNNNVAYASEDVFELPVLPDRAYSAGTGRTYIWEKTLELVKDRPLLGYGGDSLAYNFPHYNIDARAGMMDENVITDKAHNQYVGTLYGFGIIGFLAFVVLLVVVGMSTLMALVKKSWPIFTLAIVVLAYFTQAMFNDSLPGITPIAFVLLGIVLALQQQNKEQLSDGRND